MIAAVMRWNRKMVQKTSEMPPTRHRGRKMGGDLENNWRSGYSRASVLCLLVHASLAAPSPYYILSSIVGVLSVFCLHSHSIAFRGQTGWCLAARTKPVMLSHKDMGADPDMWILISAHLRKRAAAFAFPCSHMCTRVWSLTAVPCLISFLRQESLDA